MLKPIVIDSNYGIINNAAGQISRVFWEHIDYSKIRPTIVCGIKNKDLSLNNSLIQVKDRIWKRKFLGLCKRVGVPDLCFIPDTGLYSWCPYAYKKITKENHFKFDYIHSISSPQSNHLLALRLKKDFGIPWIAQFDDPWHDTSGRKYKFQFFNNLDLKYEKEVAENADIIIHSNEVIKEIWSERYGSAVTDKIIILPFNFNIYNLPKVKPIPQNPRIEISHIGHVYSTRSAMTLFEALCILKKECEEILNYLHFTFIGGIHEVEKQFVYNNNLTELITFIPTLPPDKLENYYQKSNMFLIIDINIDKSPNYPSKLMMYFYYQRPIIGITNKNCQLVRELEHTNNTYVLYGESKKLAQILKKAVLDYNTYLNFDKNYWKKHTVENVLKLYEEVLSSRLNLRL